MLHICVQKEMYKFRGENFLELNASSQTKKFWVSAPDSSSSSSAIASCARSNGATRFPLPFINPTRSLHRERARRKKGKPFWRVLAGSGNQTCPSLPSPRPERPGRRVGWPEWQQTLPDKGFNGALTCCPPVHRSGVATCLW